MTVEQARLNAEAITAVALGIIDEEGLPALNMRRLGVELGVHAMAIYRHVESKQRILDGVVELILAEVRAPQPGSDWRATITAFFRSLREVLAAHPNALPLLAHSPFSTDHGQGHSSALLALLEEAGFRREYAARLFYTLTGFTVGYVWIDVGGFVGELPGDDSPFERAKAEGGARGRLDMALEGVAAAAGPGFFEAGLELIMLGAEQTCAEA